MRKEIIVSSIFIVICIIAMGLIISQIVSFKFMRMFKEWQNASQRVYGTYHFLGYNDEKTNNFYKTMEEDSTVSYNKIKAQWNITDKELLYIREHYADFIIAEVKIFMNNNTKYDLQNAKVISERINTYVGRDSWLFCDGPKLPAYVNIENEVITYILFESKYPNFMEDNYEVENLQLFFENTPVGFPQYMKFRNSIFREIEQKPAANQTPPNPLNL